MMTMMTTHVLSILVMPATTVPVAMLAMMRHDAPDYAANVIVLVRLHLHGTGQCHEQDG